MGIVRVLANEPPARKKVPGYERGNTLCCDYYSGLTLSR